MGLLAYISEQAQFSLLLDKAAPPWLFDMLFAAPAPKISAAYEDVLARAKKAGFPDVRPEIYTARLWSSFERQFARFCFDAERRPRKGAIVVFRRTEKLPEKYIRIVLAHEIGHAIYHTSEHFGHPFLERLRGMSDEHFAFLISAYLYSKKALEEMCSEVAKFNEYPEPLLRNARISRELNHGYNSIMRAPS